MTADAAEAQERSDEAGPVYYGRVIIEWPGPQQERFALAGWMCAVYDAETGQAVSTVMRARIPSVVVHADAQNVITADLTMLADDKEMPILFPEEYPGRPGSTKVYTDEEGGIREGTFSFLVAEMRVRS